MPQRNHPNLSVEQILALEREILRALCTCAQLNAERGGLLKALASHSWGDAEHRVVYEALLRTVSRDSEALRSELPATATRMGFPDVDWGEYFRPSEVSVVKDVESRIRALAAASAKSPRRA